MWNLCPHQIGYKISCEGGIKLKNQLSRRDFIKNASVLSGGLFLGLNILSCEVKKIDISKLDRINPNIWIKILENGDTYLVVHRSEMGQGIRTSLAAVLADEMEADLSKVTIEQAEGDKKYGNQNTDGSHSVRSFYKILRTAGASVKELMIQAAAKKLNVLAEECHADSHYVYHKKSGEKVFYGDLVKLAKDIELPENPVLKKKSEFKYIRTELDNLDNDLFATGKAIYGIDASLPDMVYASIQRSPVYGGKIKSVDKTETLKFPGVIDVIEIKGTEGAALFNPLEGVAVIGTNTWAAEQGKLALKIDWDEGKNNEYNSDSYREKLEKSVKRKGKQFVNNGNVSKVFRKSKNVVDALYYLPQLTHVAMETPAALVWVQDDKCDIWASTQTPQRARSEAAKELGWDESKVTVNVTFLGGGFGRKSKPDYVTEAVKLSKILKKPVKIFWSREDDIRHSYYHSVSAQYHKASIDKDNKVDAWLHRSDFPPIAFTFNPEAKGPGGGINMGTNPVPFDIKNFRTEAGNAEGHFRIGWMRSVYNIFHGFSINCFVDELAHHRKMDPLAHLNDLIGGDRIIPNGDNPYKMDTSRLKHVLNTAAKNAKWGKKLEDGFGMGIAVHYSFYSYVAQVIEVSMINNKLKVQQVHTVIDCGSYVNKDSINNQMEGAAIFGLSLALYGEITAKDGKIEQSNFHDFQLARMKDAPKINVEIIDSDGLEAGVGEPAVPPFAPALVNAIYAASGKRYRDLPLVKHGIV
jgi:isoquinoline 1-oxidoreductase subunit beta